MGSRARSLFGARALGRRLTMGTKYGIMPLWNKNLAHKRSPFGSHGSYLTSYGGWHSRTGVHSMVKLNGGLRIQSRSIVMKKAFKYRLYPDTTTAKHLSWTLVRCRELYNAGLSERKDAYQQYQRVTVMEGSERVVAARMRVGQQLKPMSFYSQKRDLVAIKEARPEYQDIASH